MKRNLIFVLICVLLLSGCQLAQPEYEAAEEPRLIGAYVTREYIDLFDFDAYVRGHASKFASGKNVVIEDTEAYTQKLYAEIKPTELHDEKGNAVTFEEYVFPVEGMGFYCPWVEDEFGFYRSSRCDDGISGTSLNVKESDDFYGLELECTVYYEAGVPDVTFYLNPVYQDGDGNVYLLPGNGYLSNADGEGVMFSTTLTAESTTTKGDNKNGWKTSVTVQYVAKLPAEQISVVQMNAENQVVRRDSFLPEEMPETMTPEPETVYLVIEQISSGRTIRSFCQPGEMITTYETGADHVCVEKTTVVELPET